MLVRRRAAAAHRTIKLPRREGGAWGAGCSMSASDDGRVSDRLLKRLSHECVVSQLRRRSAAARSPPPAELLPLTLAGGAAPADAALAIAAPTRVVRPPGALARGGERPATDPPLAPLLLAEYETARDWSAPPGGPAGGSCARPSPAGEARVVMVHGMVANAPPQRSSPFNQSGSWYLATFNSRFDCKGRHSQRRNHPFSGVSGEHAAHDRTRLVLLNAIVAT